MLETIREFAVERLAELGGVDDAMRQLAEHLLTVAREAEAHARGPDEPAWLARLELELPNIRVALGWCVERGERALGLELGDALEPLWVRGRQHVEGLRLLESLLELPGEAPPRALAGSLAAAGRCALELGEVERGRALSAQAERIASAEGDDEHLAWALHGLGDAAAHTGDTGEARACFRRSGELFARLGMHGPAGGRESYLAELARAEGNSREAREAYERSVRSYEEAGDAAGVAGSLQGLGDVALDVGDAETALAHYRAALDRLPPAERPFDLLYVLGGFAAVAAITGRPDEAGRLWGAVERLEADLDHSMVATTRGPYEALLGELAPRLVAAGRRLSAEQAAALARTL
jgi:tetratricopeptide (TPR) repeat protein